MKLITFLGKGPYHSVIYQWGEHEKETEFFAEALAEWLQPKEVCVMLTEGAQESGNWEKLESRLQKRRLEILKVPIPDGKDESELWQIFQRVADTVEIGDELVFDITHGFRSIPVLGLLAVAYLKQVKRVQIRYLLYGALEAVPREEARKPVFDLTPFAELLDWLTAVKMFIATGNASELADLLDEAQNNAHRRSLPEPPKALKPIARWLRSVSESLMVCQAPYVGSEIRELITKIEQGEPEIHQWTQPLVPLLETVKQTYAPYIPNNLETHRALIGWYLERSHAMQAITLMREWLVSYQCRLEGKDPELMRHREAAEDTLNSLERNTRNGQHREELVDLWGSVSNLRNRIAHCGCGRSEQVEGVLQQASELYQRLCRLPIP
ncbi:CRISPR-associated protein, TM1812 family [Armatimonadetes bacterium GBS]|nr:MAG: hypothetical protein KatS3mg021_2529 [Fimbriimonadales bacterium]CUU10958.1 CRISPR-associated protein, TM1812 family [Armatimonadetes bacterium GBS]CUU37241.1 CRISPR-associated protein, TM1812 family [Armatimonadetes bacterium GXS]